MDKKQHNKYPRAWEYKKGTLRFGERGLKVLNSYKITEDKLLKMSKSLKKTLGSSSSVKWWCRIHPNSTMTKLSLESRMGKGKGGIYLKYVYVKAGSVLFEFSNLTPYQISALKKSLSQVWMTDVAEVSI